MDVEKLENELFSGYLDNDNITMENNFKVPFSPETKLLSEVRFCSAI